MQKNEITVEMMNEVIALFNGGSSVKEVNGKRYVYYPDSCAKLVSDLEYHTSWDVLMPVISKIPVLIHGTDDIEMRKLMYGRYKPIENEMCNFNIINTHYCLYQFITWYQNQQKQNNGN